MQFFKLQKKEEKKEEEEKKDEEKPKEEEKKEAKEEPVAEVPDIPPLLTRPRRVQKNLFSEALRRELDQIRRWKVKISNIHIENLYTEVYSPFIEFVIGGDEHQVQKTDKKGNTVTMRLGKPGITAKTEVLDLLELQSSRNFFTVLKTEYQGSYFDIMEQNLRVDIWDLERWGINNFFSREEIPLLDIANGEVVRNLTFQRKKGRKKCKG